MRSPGQGGPGGGPWHQGSRSGGEGGSAMRHTLRRLRPILVGWVVSALTALATVAAVLADSTGTTIPK